MRSRGRPAVLAISWVCAMTLAAHPVGAGVPGPVRRVARVATLPVRDSARMWKGAREFKRWTAENPRVARIHGQESRFKLSALRGSLTASALGAGLVAGAKLIQHLATHPIALSGEMLFLAGGVAAFVGIGVVGRRLLGARLEEGRQRTVLRGLREGIVPPAGVMRSLSNERRLVLVEAALDEGLAVPPVVYDGLALDGLSRRHRDQLAAQPARSPSP